MNSTKNKKIVLWTSIDLILPCLKERLRRKFPSAEEAEITALMHSVNFKHFEKMAEALENVSVGKPIVVFASFTDPFNKDNCYNQVVVIDSGKLGCCFDADFDLAEWYIDECGDLCSYNIDREGYCTYVYFTFKDNTPLSVKKQFFTEAEKPDCNLAFLKGHVEGIGAKVLEALKNNLYNEGDCCGK